MIYFKFLLCTISYFALGETDGIEDFHCDGVESEDGNGQCNPSLSLVLPDGVKNEIGDEECRDKAKEDYCNSDPELMLSNCIPACLESDFLLSHGYFLDDAKKDDCKDGVPVEWESEYELEKDFDEIDVDDIWCEDSVSDEDCMYNPEIMMENCAKSCMFCIPSEKETYPIGDPQIIENLDLFNETIQVMIDTVNYMQNEVMMDEKYWPVRKYCRNRHELCSEWAAGGYCEDYEGWRDMLRLCGPACQACEMFDIRIRCPHDDSTNIFKPGDITKMFETIIGEREKDPAINFPEYTATVHSRPKKSEEENQDVVDGPWVVTLDNFLTDEECEHLINIAPDQGFEKSYLIEDEDINNESEHDYDYDHKEEIRTSSTAWCKGECSEDPITKGLIEKIENITGVPSDYSEPLQFLQYIPGQYYKMHHDNGRELLHYPTGPRILTVFLYLNDVEEGGETKFNDIGNGKSLVIKPKRGLVLIWPSVLDEDPSRTESRTFHEAMIVNKGVKYGINAWLHLRNWYHHSCSEEEGNDE